MLDDTTFTPCARCPAVFSIPIGCRALHDVCSWPDLQEKPYLKQPGDMPTFPSSHDGGRASAHHHGHHHHAGAAAAVGGKRALSEAAVGLLAEAKRQALGRAGAVGGGAGGGVIAGLDDRFGAAFGGGRGGGFGGGWGGGAGGSLLEGSGVQLVRK